MRYFDHRPLIRNSIKTPDGTVLTSTHRHDYVEYTDANGKTYMVDGGLDYIRRSAHGDEQDLCLFNDEPHEVQRSVLMWGTRGIDGKQPLVYKCIAELETSHLQAILSGGWCKSYVHRCCIEAELADRKK